MIEITRAIKQADGAKRRRTYPIYELGDAMPLSARPVHWSQAREAGQYVRTDDDLVMEVVRVNGPYINERRSGSRPKWELILPVCKAWVGAGKRQLLARPFIEAGVYHLHRLQKSDEVESRKTRTKLAVKRYARSMAMGQGPPKGEELRAIARDWRPDQARPELTFKRLLRSERIQDMIADELRRVLESCGVTPESRVREQLDIIADARERGQLAVAEKANERLMDMLAMMPEKVTVNETKEIEASWEHLLEPTSKASRPTLLVIDDPALNNSLPPADK